MISRGSRHGNTVEGLSGLTLVMSINEKSVPLVPLHYVFDGIPVIVNETTHRFIYVRYDDYFGGVEYEGEVSTTFRPIIWQSFCGFHQALEWLEGQS